MGLPHSVGSLLRILSLCPSPTPAHPLSLSNKSFRQRELINITYKA